MRRRLLLLTLVSALSAAGLFSCAKEDGGFLGAPRSSGARSYSGYVVVANNASRNVVLLDPNLNFSALLVQFDLASGDIPASLALYDESNVLVAVEGVDRVLKLPLSGSGAISYILNTNLTGTMKGIARLSGGDVIVSDATTGAHLERFVDAVNPLRVTAGWPATLLNTMSMAFPLAGNSFLACAGGTSDVVRTYSNLGVQTGTASATAPTPSLGSAHDVMACVADGSGRIAAAYSGTADAIRLYNSALTSIVWTYQNPSLLSTPLALGVRPNGNFLAVDASNLVLEITAAGALSQTYSSPFISTANQILVIP